jgi:hypothetical protein
MNYYDHLAEKYQGDFPIRWRNDWGVFAATLGWFLLLWSFSTLDNVFEMWGEYTFTRGFPTVVYPFLRSFIPPLTLHLALALGGVWLFFKSFDLSQTAWWSVLIMPYVGFCTVQSTTCLPPFLVLLAIYLVRHPRLSLLRYPTIALLYIARTEFIFLAPLGRRYAIAVGVAAAVLWLATGSVVSPNSAAVGYIALGQLPGNAWGIEYHDSTALRIHPQAWYQPAMFRQRALDSIVARPGEYARKCAYNAYHVLRDGIWCGVRWKPASIVTQVIFGLVFWFHLAGWWANRGGTFSETERIVLVLLVGVIGFQVLGQQMARHTTVLYLPVLGLGSEWARRALIPYGEV